MKSIILNIFCALFLIFVCAGCDDTISSKTYQAKFNGEINAKINFDIKKMNEKKVDLQMVNLNNGFDNFLLPMKYIETSYITINFLEPIYLKQFMMNFVVMQKSNVKVTVEIYNDCENKVFFLEKYQCDINANNRSVAIIPKNDFGSLFKIKCMIISFEGPAQYLMIKKIAVDDSFKMTFVPTSTFTDIRKRVDEKMYNDIFDNNNDGINIVKHLLYYGLNENNEAGKMLYKFRTKHTDESELLSFWQDSFYAEKNSRK